MLGKWKLSWRVWHLALHLIRKKKRPLLREALPSCLSCDKQNTLYYPAEFLSTTQNTAKCYTF